MPEPILIATFHFLRPAWLLAIPVALFFAWAYQQQRDPARRYADLIAPHLLKHLVVGVEARSRLSPIVMFLWAAALAFAVAGPTWKREASPFADDTAALVIVVDASTTMNTADVPPSRLERAKQKARDLLALREGGKTGLVAFAGSAHDVLPLTDDRGIVELYLGSIDPKIMPRAGKRPDLGIAAAQALLDRDATPGSIVVFADEIPADTRAAVAAHDRKGGAPVQVLQMAPGPAMDVAGANVRTLTVDDTDVRGLDGSVQRHLADAQADSGETRWLDFGYFLLIPLVFLAGLWFRKGWFVQWAGVLLVAFVAFVVFDAEPAYADESSLTDLFWTQDQQGRRHFERGEFEDAAAHFQDPTWKATAYYRAGRYETAIAWFAKSDSATSWFNRGNAYAKMDRLDDAAHAYRQALRKEPDADDIQENLTIVLKIIQARENEEPAEGGQTLRADKYVFDDDKGEKKKRPESEEAAIGGTMDERMAEVWMRQVQTTPAAFLKSKFAIQLSAKEEDDGGGG